MGEKKIEIILPKVGRMQEATISEWLINVGDQVREGEPIFTFETDKANQDVEAEASGTLSEIIVNVGETAKVGDVLGVISVETEAPVTIGEKNPAQDEHPKDQKALKVVEKIPLTGIRMAIGKRMTESLRESAQLTLTTEIDVTASESSRPENVSPTSIIVQVAARTLLEHPLMNSSLDEEIVIWDKRNIGVAVSLDEGLVVPVIREADLKDVMAIMEEIETLAEKARSGQLAEKDLQEGTFTITNLGMYGIDAFTPILNPPEVAILGVGRWTEKPRVVNGQVEVRTMATLSLTIDHRVIDGAHGAEFLKDLAERLERGEFT